MAGCYSIGVLSENFVYVAAGIAVVANLAYLRDTLRGVSKPNRVTFFLWGVIPLIAFFAQRSSGGGLAAYFTLAIGIIPLVILAASFVDKKAYWKITRFDMVCGAISVAALVFWLVTGQGLIALMFSILADFAACVPTIIKSYRHPETETTSTYALEMISAVIVLFTIHDWTFISYGYAAYVVLMDTLFTVLLTYPRKTLS